MAKLKGIYLTEVEYHNGTNFRPLFVSDGTSEFGLTDAYLVLYRAPGAVADAPASMDCDINFANLSRMDAAGEVRGNMTAFHALGNGIPTTQKSPVIRYKIVVGTYTTEEVFTVNSQWHYIMLKGTFAANPYNTASCTSTTTESTKAITLALYFPAFTSTHVDSNTVTLLHNLIKTKANWAIKCVNPDGATELVAPSTVTTGSPSTSGASDYGLARMLVTMTAQLSFPRSGTYTITATFQSNDNDQAGEIPNSHTVTASIFVNSGSGQPFIFSFDADATLTINIA